MLARGVPMLRHSVWTSVPRFIGQTSQAGDQSLHAPRSLRNMGGSAASDFRTHGPERTETLGELVRPPEDRCHGSKET